MLTLRPATVVLPLLCWACAGCGSSGGPGADGRSGDGQDPGPPPLASSAVSFPYDGKLFTGQTFDTGWQPSGSSVQVRFYVTLKAQVTSSAKGVARLSRDADTGLMLDYRGSSGGGKVAMDIGLEMSCKLKISYSSISWEGAVPFTPQYDFRFADSSAFTPFLLEGAKGRPVHLEDTAAQKQIFSVPVPGLGIPYVGGGAVALKAGGKLGLDFAGGKIVTTPQGGAALSITKDGQSVKWPERGRTDESGQAVYTGQASYTGTVVLSPSAVIETNLLGKSLTLAEFPISIDVAKLGLTSQTLTFDPQTVTFHLAGGG
jgi:hypothetical protein